MKHPITESLKKLRLHSMAEVFESQQNLETVHKISFDDRLSLLINSELLAKENRNLERKIKLSKIPERVLWAEYLKEYQRGIDEVLLTRIQSLEWLHNHLNLLIIGPTGVGKTFVACAVAHQVCLQGGNVLYIRLPRLFEETEKLKSEGNYLKWLKKIALTDLLILDDWGLQQWSDSGRRDILEILEERYHKKSTIITSQIAVEEWKEQMGNDILADAILDRLVHQALLVKMHGASMRKLKGK